MNVYGHVFVTSSSRLVSTGIYGQLFLIWVCTELIHFNSLYMLAWEALHQVLPVESSASAA